MYRQHLMSTWSVYDRRSYERLVVLAESADGAEREFRMQTGIRRAPLSVEFLYGPQSDFDPNDGRH